MYNVHRTGLLQVSILNASEDKNGLKGIALDVQSCLVRSAPLPLSDQLMVTLFPAAIQVSLTTDDNTVLQAGGECLRSYNAVAPEQVASFTDNQVNSTETRRSILGSDSMTKSP